MKVKGWPLYTIIRGNIVMREDELLEPIGKEINSKKRSHENAVIRSR